MCGIAGFIHFERDKIAESSIIKNMTDSLFHRGPDGEGFYCHQNIGLGHRRLSIIDVDEGSQPMFNEDQSIAIIFNGEIYNYIELREELILAGHRFHTDSDTEVIIKAYQEWGIKCQDRFNGMWAFALWDKREQQLFLSIDRIGEKPLYYTTFNYSFIWASELKSIFAYGVPKKNRDELMEIYLTLGYIPHPFTFYKDIYKLSPGHYLIVKDGNSTISKYWDIPQIPEEEMHSSKKYVYEEFENLLYDSVKIRMRSDVPFGAFLSGGLDSSSIVSIMSSISSHPVKTFTMGFEEKAFDETHLAKLVANQCHTQHHEFSVNPENFEYYLDKIVKHYDEPFGDSSAIPTDYISSKASQYVKMVLTGDGGDEVLSGYTAYQGEKFSQQYKHYMPRFIGKIIPTTINLVSTPFQSNIRYRLNRIQNILNTANLSFQERLIKKLSWTPNICVSELIATKDVIRIEDYISNLFKDCLYKDSFYKLMYFHFKVSLPSDMLVKVDRMTMSNSLEARAPFLDYRLIELMVKVSKNVKMKGYERKTVLRNTIAKKLPEQVLKASKKGFGVPLREWFKDDSFNLKLKSLSNINYDLNISLVNKIIDQNKKGIEDYGNFIWMLFVIKKIFDN